MLRGGTEDWTDGRGGIGGAALVGATGDGSRGASFIDEGNSSTSAGTGGGSCTIFGASG